MLEKLKTPFFLIKGNILNANIQGFRRALDSFWPNSIIAYSVKTNSLPWILRWMNEHGIYAEVVSDEEFQLAQLSGYAENNIVFNGPIKTDVYLKQAFEKGTFINIDSANELEYIRREHPLIDGNIGIRINVNPQIFNSEDVGYQENGFRFGFSEENGELKAVIDFLHSIYGNVSIGLHMHVNSVTRSLNVYRAIAKYGANIIRKYKVTPSFVDIGGGFFGGVPGKPTPEEYIYEITNELEQAIDTMKTKLIIEPGSAAIGSAIELHTSVIDVKDTQHARIVTTDGSRIHIDPLWIKKGYMYTTDSSQANHPKQIICGYTCMDHDRIMVLENQPELAVGNHIIYHRVGNYTVTFGGPFIRPFPQVYVDNENGVQLVRKMMTMSDYYRLETV